MADPGICPTCGKPLTYGSFYIVEKKDGRPVEGYTVVECSGKRCSFRGKELYAIEYVTIAEEK